jgi:metallo-beta-lactamase class B
MLGMVSFLRGGAAPFCLFAVVAPLAFGGELVPDPPLHCDACDGWNRPHEPFHVFGNTFYVGTAELASILVVTDAGLVLLDGALPQSAPAIAANLATLGYTLDDVKLILNSHTHHDHAGGLAALQRASGAAVAASPRSAEALRRGGPTPDDPQFGMPDHAFPPLARVRESSSRSSSAASAARATRSSIPPGAATMRRAPRCAWSRGCARSSAEPGALFLVEAREPFVVRARV